MTMLIAARVFRVEENTVKKKRWGRKKREGEKKKAVMEEVSIFLPLRRYIPIRSYMLHLRPMVTRPRRFRNAKWGQKIRG